MGRVSDFFLERRSVVSRNMSSRPINKKHLNLIISAGIRVPDHGALNPWKLFVMQGDILKTIDKKVILSEFIKENPNTDKKIQDIQSKKLQRAGAVIAVLSTPVEHPSIPEWEMQLSSGAVCMNLLSCAQSLGYAAQWLTEWYAYNDKMLKYFEGIKDKDKIAGFIYIGHKIDEPNERKRPDPNEVVTFL
ncbi:nitroreductase [bacterium]|nr:nitroreductase [bacterium]